MYSEDNSIILNRMLNKVPNDLDKSEGSFFYDGLSPISEELAKSKIQLDEVLKRVFAQTAAENGYSKELENRCAEFGITRKAGTKATGQVTFIGTPNITIPANTVVQTEGGLQFITLEETTIVDTIANANIEAMEVGNQHNIPSNVITELPVQVTGVISVNNSNPITGGSEKESDEDLLNRLLLKVRIPATSGNIGHYKLWATEVEGVGNAIVIPLVNGPGTVKVIVLDSNKHTPSADIINSVKDKIEANRPIGATVSVVGAVEVSININAKLQLASGADIDSVKVKIQQGVKAYLDSIAFKDPLVRYTRIANVLLDVPPIIDYSNLTVNGGNANIEIAPGSVAVLGSVVVTSA